MGLSNIDISAHGAVSLEADCWSRNGSNCLTLVVKMGGEQETEVSLFFRGPHAQPAIQIYADAISEATKKIGDLQLTVLSPSVAAERVHAMLDREDA